MKLLGTTAIGLCVAINLALAQGGGTGGSSGGSAGGATGGPTAGAAAASSGITGSSGIARSAPSNVGAATTSAPTRNSSGVRTNIVPKGGAPNSTTGSSVQQSSTISQDAGQIEKRPEQPAVSGRDSGTIKIEERTQRTGSSGGAYVAQIIQSHSSPPAQISGQTNNWLISKLIGTPVYNAQDDEIGRIVDLVMDPRARVTTALISVGPYLGVGERNVQVPLSTLRFPAGTTGASHSSTRLGPERAVLNVTKAILEGLPPS